MIEKICGKSIKSLMKCVAFYFVYVLHLRCKMQAQGSRDRVTLNTHSHADGSREIMWHLGKWKIDVRTGEWKSGSSRVWGQGKKKDRGEKGWERGTLLTWLAPRFQRSRVAGAFLDPPPPPRFLISFSYSYGFFFLHSLFHLRDPVACFFPGNSLELCRYFVVIFLSWTIGKFWGMSAVQFWDRDIKKTTWFK